MTQPQPELPDTAEPSQGIAQAPIGRAILIVGAAAVVFIAFATFSSMPEEEQVASAASAVDPFASISLEARAAIVVDIRSGKTLYEKNADAQLPLASLTKVALALAVAEVLPLESVVTIPYYVGGTGSNAHLSKGEQWRIADIIDFTLVESSNSGAAILAEVANDPLLKLYPDSPPTPAHAATLARMNALATTLGLQQTYFLNVSGLDFSSNQAGAYGSARDMAKLFAYAASAQPSLFNGTTRDGILLTMQNGKKTPASNTNEAQGLIPGLIIGKTGFTDLAGGNLAVVFDVGLSHPVVAVVLGSSEHGRFSDMQKLVRAVRASLRTGE